MGTQTTQAQPSLSKRIRRKLRRIKRLTIGYIRNMAAYKAYRQWRHYITGPLRMARATVLLEDHQEQKAQQVKVEQERAAQFTLSQAATPEHPVIQVRSIPLCGGAPIQVARTGDLVRHYHEEVVRQEVAGVPTQPTALHPVKQVWVMDIFTPIVPEVLPQRVGVTEEKAQFLLDQPIAIPEVDPDQTEARMPRIQKAG